MSAKSRIGRALAGRLRRRNGGLRLTTSPTPPALSLHGALNNALTYGDISQDRIIEAHPTTAWRWVKTAVKRTEELGAIAPGKHISTHTLRHSYARHLLMNGIPHQLPIALAGALVNTDDAHLSGACAGPDGEFGDGAVKKQRSVPSYCLYPYAVLLQYLLDGRFQIRDDKFALIHACQANSEAQAPVQGVRKLQ